MTDEQILDEFERRAMKLRDFMGYPTTDGVRVIEGVRALLAASAPNPSAEPVASMTLTGAQLLEAFNFVAPDYPNDADQLECEVTISYGEGHAGKGHYVWITDYADEGAILLDGKQAEGIAPPTKPVDAEPVAIWAAFDAQGNLLAHSKLRPGLSDILKWEPLHRAAPLDKDSK